MGNRKGALALVAAISLNTLAGVPIAWDIRLGMDTYGSAPTPYNVVAARGETLDFMPRFTDRGVPLAITTNSAIRVYLREYGTTNAFTASYLSGAVFTNTADLGRVRVSLLPSDIVAATNQFFVGCDVGGRIYRAYGKLTMLDSPGGEPGTNTTVRGIVDWATVDSVNASYAPFLLSSYTYTPTASNLAAIASMVAPSTSNIVNAAIAAITPASIGALTNEADTLSSVAARGGFAGTESVNLRSVQCTDGNNQVAQIAGGSFSISNPDEYGITISLSDGLLMLLPSGGGWRVGATDLTYGSAAWSFDRPNGSYTVAATADITAHNADTASHPDKIDAHTATNIAVAMQSSGLTYYLAGNTVSDRVSSMTNRLMTQTYTLASNAVNSITQTVPSNNFYVAAFITASNTVVQPIAPGVIQVHAHIAFTDVSVNSTAFITVELYRKNAAGVDVDEFGSGEILPLVEGGAITDYTWAIPITARIDGTGYRYGLKFKIVNSTISGADTITLQTEGGTLSRMVVPVNNGIYVTEAELPWRNGTLYGTNGTYRVVGTNTYWILTP